MVCTPGRGRMAAMVRLLTIGSLPEKSPEEVGHNKVALHTIKRQFCDADEANLLDENEEVGHDKVALHTIKRQFCDADDANLLDENDMHVFDSSPLADPLHLVCCNACKKPVKASQYAAHAERCCPTNTMKNAALELDGGAGHKKPPRKERKNFQATNANQGRKQEKSEAVGGDSAAASEPNLDDQNGVLSTLSIEPQTTSNPVTITDAARVHLGGMNCSAGVMFSPDQHYEFCQRHEMHKLNDVIGLDSIRRIILSESFEDVPIPLATKTYYSQGSHRLRTALGRLYCETSARGHGSYSICGDLKQEKTMLSSQAPCPSKSFHGTHGHEVPRTKETHPLASVSNPDQMLAQSSEVCLETPGGLPSAVSFSNQFQEKSSLRPGLPVATASAGMMKSSYLSTPYLYSGNSGTALSKMQQANGSVPVG